MTWVDNKDFKHQRDIQNERDSMKLMSNGRLRALDKRSIEEVLERYKKSELNEDFKLGFSEKELSKTKKDTLVKMASEIRINHWEKVLASPEWQNRWK